MNLKLTTFKLNTFHLKIIATILMVVDHIAYALIPQTESIYWIMRMIGRVSAPLFWFCFTEGYRHTSNRQKYITRLGVAAAIMSIGNLIINCTIGNKTHINIEPISPNMFLTFFMLAIIIQCFEILIHSTNILKRIRCLFVSIMSCLVVGVHAEYGWYALFSILC